MKVTTIICGVLVACLAGLAASASEEPDYKVGFELAAYQLRTVFINQEWGTELRTKIFQYIQNSKTGTKYFLHLLVMLHEVLNEPEVKKVLDFLESNGVDPNQLFSVKVPPQLYESLTDFKDGGKKGVEEEDPAKADEDERVLKSLVDGSKLSEIVNIQKLLKVILTLLENNDSVKKVYEMLSGPGVKDAVVRIVTKPEFAAVFKEIGEILEDTGIASTDLLFGIMKMFNVKGDKRKMEPVQRVVEGLQAMMDCEEGEEGKVCKALKKWKTGKKTEL